MESLPGFGKIIIITTIIESYLILTLYLTHIITPSPMTTLPNHHVSEQTEV
jgi:hypothetical protein